MRWPEALAALLLAAPAAAQPPPPDSVTLEQVLSIVAASPRVEVAQREVDAARAERDTAGALLNPTLQIGSARPAGGERTLFDANRQDIAALELPVPIFGQRGARMRAADRGVERADSQLRLTASEARRQAALEFVRLLSAQEQLAARRRAAAEVERIRGLVAGRLESGMASRYDLARAQAEATLSALAVQRAATEAGEHAAILSALADAPAWRPRAAGSLQELRIAPVRTDLEAALERSPAVRVARDEAAVAEARAELARRERYPVPSLGVSRTWTSGPFGAANFIGLTSEIPILDGKRGLEDKAQAEAAAARQRARAAAAAFRADYLRHAEALELRRAALDRIEEQGLDQPASFLGMAESAYRLGRGTLFELLEARRTQLEAEVARLELLAAIAESQIELSALGGEL